MFIYYILYIYMYYIHSEHRIRRFVSGKGAGPIKKEQQGSNKGATREQQGSNKGAPREQGAHYD